MEMTLTQGIMLFNQRVTKQIDNLERGIMNEITGLQTELQKEEKRRTENDQCLLGQVREFLTNLQQPNVHISPIKVRHNLHQEESNVGEEESDEEGQHDEPNMAWQERM